MPVTTPCKSPSTKTNPSEIHSTSSVIQTINDLRTYDMFATPFSYLPPFLPDIDPPWSVDAYFLQNLDGIQLPTNLGSQSQPPGQIPSIQLPKETHLTATNASILLKVDQTGTVYLEPTIHFPIRRSKSPSHSNGTGSFTVSLLPGCHSIGIVGDPRGHEKLVAFGRVSDIGRGANDEEDGAEDGEWIPDWMVVSNVLPGGRIRRLMAKSTCGSRSGCKSAKGDQ